MVKKVAIRKVYVNVMAEFTKDGNLMPRTIIWEDGTNYEIQRIKDCRRAASVCANLNIGQMVH